MEKKCRKMPKIMQEVWQKIEKKWARKLPKIVEENEEMGKK